MAGTTQKVVTNEAVADSVTAIVADLEILRAGLNDLATKFNAVLTKLDADAGVTDTNYSATQAATRTTYDAASDLTGFALTK